MDLETFWDKNIIFYFPHNKSYPMCKLKDESNIEKQRSFCVGGIRQFTTDFYKGAESFTIEGFRKWINKNK